MPKTRNYVLQVPYNVPCVSARMQFHKLYKVHR